MTPNMKEMFPDAANLMSILLFRMLKYSGNFYEFAEMDRDKLLSSIMFTVDATTVVSGATHFEVKLQARLLNVFNDSLLSCRIC